MNSVLIAVGAGVILWLGYRWYGRVLARLWGMDPKNATPAVTMPDGVDYVAAKSRLVLFGHHFASIAGAGPVLGPVLACALWGWGAGLAWIVLGSVFIGGVHDFSALMASLRHRGRSVGEVAEVVMGKRAKLIFCAFVWLALVLVVAVFAAYAAEAMATEPRLVIPTFGLVAIAMLVGWLMYRRNTNVSAATVVGILLLAAVIVLGYYVPVHPGPQAIKVWLVVLFIYCYVASIMPVNILLQPRDYLSTYILYAGMGFGVLGIFLTHPTVQAPVYVQWKAAQGPMWPMMFVIIACGAISGFHALVAGGTTSKQLANEGDALRIAYGGMIVEGGMAVVALMAVAAGLKWHGAVDAFPAVLKARGPIVAFGQGYGRLVEPIFGRGLGALIAITTLNAFIMTTLDTATRIGRYIGEELFGQGLGIAPMRNRYISTAVLVGFAGYLAAGPYKAIWPVFGAANQLVAALVLITVALLLREWGKKSRYAAWPAVFMFVTTVGALVYQGRQFMLGRQYLLAGIAGCLVVLALFMAVEAVRALARPAKGQ